MNSAIRDGPGTVVRSLHLEHYGGVEALDAAFDPAFARLSGREGKAVAAALRVILRANPPLPENENARVTAELERDGEQFKISAAWDQKTHSFQSMMNGSVPCEPSAFFPCEEERSLAFFRPLRNATLADRLQWYRDPERFYRRDEFRKRTGGIGTTQTFRLCLKNYIDRFFPRRFAGEANLALCPDGRFVPENGKAPRTKTDRERFELACFTCVNRFWWEVESVRDLHYAPLPFMITSSEQAFLPFQKELLNTGRQTFFLRTDYGT